MNTEKTTGSKKNGATRNKFEDEFRDLPLEDKFKSLFRMEVSTLEETFSYVADASMKAFEKAGEVINDFSKKVETEVKKATASSKSDDAPKTAASTGKASAKKKTTASRKQPPKKSSSN
ncbi:MAG: hypothetical protein WBD16_07030 [Pyrinomonadaceae bacterium]